MAKIGLEIHVQLDNCKSKLFCGCTTKKSKEPNTNTCPTCLGLPGAKPRLNKKAVESSIKAALALKCEIKPYHYFSRKTYFFPDLAKNFQITQFETPVGEKGNFEGVDIKRVHLEEDPASLIHRPNLVLVDYNRSGIPLLEIVTDPQIKNARQARLLIQQLTVVMEYLEIYSKESDSSLRCDVNVSVHGGKRVEIKNIGSAYDVEHAIHHELKIQMKKPAKVQQTKGWDTEKKITFSQREKELEDDYGYITEPDLAKTVVTKADIETYQRELPALATDRVKFYMEKYKIQREDAKTISSSMALSDLYEEVTTKANPVFAAKWIRRELVRVLKYKKLKLEKTKIKADHLIEIINAVQKDTITVRVAQKLMEQLVNKPFNVAQKIKTMSGRIDDKRALEVICKKVILSNPKVVENYKDGEKNALNFLIGQVMRETKGAADPAIVSKILRSKL